MPKLREWRPLSDDDSRNFESDQELRPALGFRPWLAFLRRTLAFFFEVRFDMVDHATGARCSSSNQRSGPEWRVLPGRWSALPSTTLWAPSDRPRAVGPGGRAPAARLRRSSGELVF